MPAFFWEGGGKEVLKGMHSTSLVFIAVVYAKHFGRPLLLFGINITLIYIYIYTVLVFGEGWSLQCPTAELKC